MKFSSSDITQFIFLLRKGVYPYEYMDDCQKFNETILLEKEELHNNLNMQITSMQKEFVKTWK